MKRSGRGLWDTVTWRWRQRMGSARTGSLLSAWPSFARALRARLAVSRAGWRPAAMVLRPSDRGGAWRSTTVVQPMPGWALTVRPHITLVSRARGQAAVVSPGRRRGEPREALVATPARRRPAPRQTRGTPRGLVVPRRSVRSSPVAPQPASRLPPPIADVVLASRRDGLPVRRAVMEETAALTVRRRTGWEVLPAEGGKRRSRRFHRVEDPGLSRGVRPVKARLAPTAYTSYAHTNPPAAAQAFAPTPIGRPQTAMPAINVDVLAAQVVRQIDRRITAWRERTGRI